MIYFKLYFKVGHSEELLAPETLYQIKHILANTNWTLLKNKCYFWKSSFLKLSNMFKQVVVQNYKQQLSNCPDKLQVACLFYWISVFSTHP